MLGTSQPSKEARTLCLRARETLNGFKQRNPMIRCEFQESDSRWCGECI